MVASPPSGDGSKPAAAGEPGPTRALDGAVVATPGGAATAAGKEPAPPTAIPLGPPFRCSLPAPRVSDDACAADADCAVDAPCHARACVGKAKGNPPTPQTMCTRQMICDSVDANRCGCHEGRCALIPRADAQQK